MSRSLLLKVLMGTILFCSVENGAVASVSCESFFDSKSVIERAPLIDRLTTKVILNPINTLSDPLRSRLITARMRDDRKRAQEAIASASRSSAIETFSNLLQALKFENAKPRVVRWDSKSISVGMYGADTLTSAKPVSANDLKVHFRKVLPSKLSTTANRVLDAALDAAIVDPWISDVKLGVLKRMWDDGIRDLRVFKTEQVRELYLDRELAARAAQAGFEIGDDGLPFNVVTFRARPFYRGLEQGRLFVDWTGANVEAGKSKDPHFARGHLLQMVFAAETVPGFVDLVKHIGQTNDSFGIWRFLFDNLDSTSTPLWTGFWVRAFGGFLFIRY